MAFDDHITRDEGCMLDSVLRGCDWVEGIALGLHAAVANSLFRKPNAAWSSGYSLFSDMFAVWIARPRPARLR